MAQSLSAIKRVRQNEKQRLRNRSYRTRLRTQVNKLRAAIDADKADEAKKLLPDTISLVDVLVKKGILHENTGNRYKSRLTRRLSVLAAS